MNSAEGMGSAPAGKVPRPADEAEAKCYRLDPAKGFKRGELCIPGNALMASILSAAAGFKIKVNGKSTTPKPYLAGGSWIEPGKVGIGAQDYEVYVTSAVVQGKRVMRARARVVPWSARFALTFSQADPIFEDIGLGLKDVMPQILRIAGSMKGLLDNRPSAPKKPGPHGTFKVLKCELAEE